MALTRSLIFACATLASVVVSCRRVPVCRNFTSLCSTETANVGSRRHHHTTLPCDDVCLILPRDSFSDAENLGKNSNRIVPNGGADAGGLG